MKLKLLSLLAASALVLGAAPAPAANVSVSVFYDALEPYGEWIDTNDYGYVWHPRDVDENWRPYTVGNWAYTDAGWTWVSEEPFGWATYHYGRWAEIDRVGWAWVPDREWAPAWVSWRRSDRHVGWAPLPPEARFEARTGFRGWVDSYYDIGPRHYSFVNVRDFGAPRLRTVILQPRENVTIVNETRNITNITYVNNVVVNEGPQYDVVVRESAQPIRRLKLERRTDIDYRAGQDRGRFASEIRGDVLRVAAPEVEVNRETAPRKINRKLDRVEVDRGWRNAGDPQAVEQLRTKVASETKVPAELPPSPRLRGDDRPIRGDREPTTASEPQRRPGAPTAETSPLDVKPGAEKPSTGAAQDPKARGEKEKSRTAAAADEKQKPAAAAPAEGKDKARPTAGAETPSPRGESTTDPVTAQQRRSAKEKAPNAAAAPAEEAQRPGAVTREPTPRQPESGEGDRLRPGAPERPDRDLKKRSEIAPPNVEHTPARTPERTSGNRPEGNDRAKRPDAALERPERPERKAPPAAAEDREMRKAPPVREERSPERPRPEVADRSPQNRTSEASQKPAAGREEKVPGGGKPQKGRGEEKKEANGVRE